MVLFGGEKQTPNVIRESNTSRLSYIIINLTKPLLPKSIQNQFDDLSISKLEDNSSNTSDVEGQSFTDTTNQVYFGTELSIAEEAQAAEKPVAVTLQERPVD